MKNIRLLSTMMVLALAVSACAASPKATEPAEALKPAVSQPAPAEEEKTMEPAVSQSVSEKAKPANRYMEYSKAAFDEASGKRRVLFFYASWCPTCRSADPNFQANMNLIPEDVVLLRVNYNDPQTDDEEKALAKTYGITYQHTFVQVDSLGKAVLRWNGGEINELLAKVKPA